MDRKATPTTALLMQRCEQSAGSAVDGLPAALWFGGGTCHARACLCLQPNGTARNCQRPQLSKATAAALATMPATVAAAAPATTASETARRNGLPLRPHVASVAAEAPATIAAATARHTGCPRSIARNRCRSNHTLQSRRDCMPPPLSPLKIPNNRTQRPHAPCPECLPNLPTDNCNICPICPPTIATTASVMTAAGRAHLLEERCLALCFLCAQPPQVLLDARGLLAKQLLPRAPPHALGQQHAIRNRDAASASRGRKLHCWDIKNDDRRCVVA
eukprot:364479-Chlamydomonas_euryale.AAC.18